MANRRLKSVDIREIARQIQQSTALCHNLLINPGDCGFALSPPAFRLFLNSSPLAGEEGREKRACFGTDCVSASQ